MLTLLHIFLQSGSITDPVIYEAAQKISVIILLIVAVYYFHNKDIRNQERIDKLQSQVIDMELKSLGVIKDMQQVLSEMTDTLKKIDSRFDFLEKSIHIK
jgi:hypothetical protein